MFLVFFFVFSVFKYLSLSGYYLVMPTKIILYTLLCISLLSSCANGGFLRSKKKTYHLKEKDKEKKDFLSNEADKVIDKSSKRRKKEEKKDLKNRARAVDAEKKLAESNKNDKKKKAKKINTGAFDFY